MARWRLVLCLLLLGTAVSAGARAGAQGPAYVEAADAGSLQRAPSPSRRRSSAPSAAPSSRVRPPLASRLGPPLGARPAPRLAARLYLTHRALLL